MVPKAVIYCWDSETGIIMGRVVTFVEFEEGRDREKYHKPGKSIVFTQKLKRVGCTLTLEENTVSL